LYDGTENSFVLSKAADSFTDSFDPLADDVDDDVDSLSSSICGSPVTQSLFRTESRRFFSEDRVTFSGVEFDNPDAAAADEDEAPFVRTTFRFRVPASVFPDAEFAAAAVTFSSLISFDDEVDVGEVT
jgi:hypothetical protein